MLLGILDTLVVSQCFDAPAENEQRRVDVPCLLLPIASVQGLLDSFRSCQVTERKHRHSGKVRFLLLR